MSDTLCPNCKKGTLQPFKDFFQCNNCEKFFDKPHEADNPVPVKSAEEILKNHFKMVGGYSINLFESDKERILASMEEYASQFKHPVPVEDTVKEDAIEITETECYYQQSVMNPYYEGESQSNTAYKKGFYECFEHFFKKVAFWEQRAKHFEKEFGAANKEIIYLQEKLATQKEAVLFGNFLSEKYHAYSPGRWLLHNTNYTFTTEDCYNEFLQSLK